MNPKFTNWFLFIALSFIWGSSFILMKEGLVYLTAFQVASIRIISAGLVLLPVTFKAILKIPSKKLFIVFMSGVFGSLLPAYLFCLAEQGIDSSLAGALNSLTPIFVVIAGALFFETRPTTQKVIGILIALTGSVLLFLNQPNFSENSNTLFVLYVIMATVFYGYNVNMVHRHLDAIGSLQIAAVALSLNAIPAGIILFFTGYFSQDFLGADMLKSAGYSFVLGIFGSAIASVLFYALLKKAGAVFASMVTYGIPIVAIIWGIIYGEQIGWKQAASMAVMLFGVWWVNRKPKVIVETT
jgi:drug/metabolite transporter (DMT)-like permease